MTGIELVGMAVAAVAVLALLLRPKWTAGKGPLPPGPAGYPIVGNLLSLMWSSHRGEAPFTTFAKWAQQYGAVCYLRFASQGVVVISDAQIAQEMCVKQADVFTERPPGLFVSQVLKGKGTASSNLTLTSILNT